MFFWKQIPISLLMLLSAFLCLMLAIKADPQSAHLLGERAFESGAQMNVRPLNLVEGDVMDKVESRLMGALELLQTYREAPATPKFAEKRKNKFEFIRFGKRRR